MRATSRSGADIGPRDIARRRLANQRLIGAPFTTPVEVVRRLGAVQSQDYAGGKWGVAQRTPGATDADVERALTDGAIVRTHVLRPTWHFVAAEDIRWMLALTAPRVRAAMAFYDRKLELDDKVFARSAAAITKALAGGRQLTRTELGKVLQRARIDTTVPQRLGQLMMRAELEAIVCSGVRKGKQSTYALLEERVRSAPAMQREEALAELARRYFTTRGPATAHDFAWWSGLTVTDAKRGAEALGSELEHHAIDGRTHWFTGAAPPATTASNAAHLLPNYDEYFIGLKDRSAFGDLVKTSAVDVPAETFLAHIVTVDGQLVGGWKRTVSAREISLRVQLVVEIRRGQMRSIEAQARRYGEFHELPVNLAVETTRSSSSA